MNLQCPHCDAAITISGVQAGAQVRCGGCAQVFLMPQQQPVQQVPIASYAPQQPLPQQPLQQQYPQQQQLPRKQKRDRDKGNAMLFILPLVMVLIVGGGLLGGYLFWENSKYEAAEKTYLGACRIYNEEIKLSYGALLGSPSDQYLSGLELMKAQGEAFDKQRKLFSDAKAKYEKAYSTFSKICADLGKPPPVKMMIP